MRVNHGFLAARSICDKSRKGSKPRDPKGIYSSGRSEIGRKWEISRFVERLLRLELSDVCHGSTSCQCSRLSKIDSPDLSFANWDRWSSHAIDANEPSRGERVCTKRVMWVSECGRTWRENSRACTRPLSYSDTSLAKTDIGSWICALSFSEHTFSGGIARRTSAKVSSIVCRSKFNYHSTAVI